MKRQRGVTLVEATIVLLTLAILGSIIVATATPTLRSARLTRAADDVAALRQAMLNFATDNAIMGFRSDGSVAAVTTQMLVGSGDIPTDGGGGATAWTDAVDNTNVDLFERHLTSNTPGGAFSYTAGAAAWRGAYISAPVAADPWGNRYAANVGFLATATTEDVVVISAGPNEVIESAFTQDGFVAGGDDIFVIVSASRI